jgi:hypothetical protein
MGQKRWIGPPPLQEINLIVTSRQVENMADRNAIGFLPMRAMDLLELTTDDLFYTIMAEALPLEEYNRFALEGETIVPPMIKVRASSGKIVSEEGRHRAAALIHEAGSDAEMWVGLFLVDDEYNIIRGASAEDVGDFLIGQYSSIARQIDPDRICTLGDLWR